MMQETIKVDLISDTVCPWCYVGKRRMELAMQELPEFSFDLLWRPYQLNPDMPAEGIARADYLKRKFGKPKYGKTVTGALVEAGESVGVDFQFDKIERMPNTLDSHRLIRWARNDNVQAEVVDALFDHYFVQGHDVSDHDLLLEIARGAGMDTDLVRGLLNSDADIDLIKQEDQAAREMGVSGVPSYLMIDKFIITGAQDVHALKMILTRVAKKMAEASGTIQ